MANVRQPGDAWHTVLYREPHRWWWAPAAATLVLLVTLRQVITDEAWTSSLLFAGIVSAGSALISWAKHRSRRRR